LEEIAKATAIRRRGQQGFIHAALVGGTGGAAGVGAILAGPVGAAKGAAMSLLIGAIRSPQWRTVAAVTKGRLADALASGQYEAAQQILQPLAAGATSVGTRGAHRRSPKQARTAMNVSGPATRTAVLKDLAAGGAEELPQRLSAYDPDVLNIYLGAADAGSLQRLVNLARSNPQAAEGILSRLPSAERGTISRLWRTGGTQ
jgi:hypothetical protein